MKNTEEIINILSTDAEQLMGISSTSLRNKDMNLYISSIKALKDTMNLIKEYDWHSNYSEYRTGDDNHMEVATWEQNSESQIRNHKRYLISEVLKDNN